VGLAKVGARHVVAIKAELRCRLGQMIRELRFTGITGLVEDMAGVASTVHGWMPAAVRRYVQTDVVAREAEILGLIARHGLEQHRGVVRSVGVVTLETVAIRECVQLSMNVGRSLVIVTRKTQARRRRRDQLDSRHVFADPYLVAAQTAGLHGRVDDLPLRLVLVALETLCGADVRI
jgi:hypothetical protein